MNKIHLTAIICSLLAFSACTTDFDVAAEWKDIPVVYGFLNVTDTAHYIRVEKAFLDPEGDAFQIAEIADSLYYGDEVAVQLELLETGDVYTLEKVDGTLEGYPREEGPFAETPNYLYKVSAAELDLEGGEAIRFKINRGDNQDPIIADTRVLQELEPIDNVPPDELNLAYNNFPRISWRMGEFAQIFDIRMTFHYRESDPDNPSQFINKSVTWVLEDQLLRESDATSRQTITFLGESFYTFIGSAVEGTSDRIRLFDQIELTVTAAGQELADFLEITLANTGITSSQVVPTFTNLSDGRGIFTSRSSFTRSGIGLNFQSLDSLRNGIHTQHLNFQ